MHALQPAIPTRRGLTLTEVVITGVILTLLIAFALSFSVVRLRADARKVYCINWLKNLSLATNNYAANNGGRLPLLTTGAEPFTSGGISPSNVAWTVTLLPYLENSVLSRQLYLNPAAGEFKLKVFSCPNDTNNSGQPGGLSYVANAGYGAFAYDAATASVSENTWDWQGQTLGHSPDAYLIDWDGDGQFSTPDKPDAEDQAIQRASGVFWRPAHDGFQMTQDYVSTADGMNSTILFTESLNAGFDGNWASPSILNMAFVFGGNPAPRIGPRLKAGLKPLDTGTDASTHDFILGEVIDGKRVSVYGLNQSRGNHRGRLPAPGSYHPGAVNTAFAGGNCKSISDTIDPTVWARLMTPDGRQFGQAELEDADY